MESMGRTNRRKIAFPVAVCAFLSMLLPLTGLAQTPPQYKYDPTWPVNGGVDAPRFTKQEFDGVAADAQGRIYMCRPSRPAVLIFDQAGNYIGAWDRAVLGEPHSIRVDDQGYLWVVDKELHQVFKFRPDGTLVLSLGTFRRRGKDATHFDAPTDIAFDSRGDAFISDGYGNSRVVHFTAEGQYVGEWGSRGSAQGQFRLPHSIAIDSQDRVYVADRENKRVQVFTTQGRFLSQFPTTDKPFGLYIPPTNELFISYEVGYVGIYNLNGTQSSRLDSPPPPVNKKGQPKKKWWLLRRPGDLSEPHMCTVDNQLSLYTAELRGHRVQKFVRQ